MKHLFSLMIIWIFMLTFNFVFCETIFDAAKDGDSEFISEYVKNGGNINIFHVNEYGLKDKTPLMFAAEAGNEKSINLLLSKGADVNAHTPYPILKKTSYYIAALNYAAISGKDDCLRILIKSGTDLKMFGELAMREAAANKHADSVRILKEAGAIFSDTNTILIIGEYDSESLQILMNNGFNCTNSSGILIYAAGRSDIELIKVLIKGGVDLKKFEADALCAAVDNMPFRGGLTDIGSMSVGTNKNGQFVTNSVKMHVADPLINDRRSDPEWDATVTMKDNTNAECLRILIEAGADVNSKRKDGKTPLKIARSWGFQHCATLLMNAGATN